MINNPQNIGIVVGLVATGEVVYRLVINHYSENRASRQQGKGRYEKHLLEVTKAVQDHLRKFLQEDTVYVDSNRGILIQISNLIDDAVRRRLGSRRTDLLSEEIDVPADYRFTITYSHASQNGFDVHQPYVNILATGITLAAQNLGYPTRTYGIGNDLTLVKGYEEQASLKAMDKLGIDDRLNFVQAINTLAGQNNYPSNEMHLFFHILNGSSPIADHVKKVDHRFPDNSRHYVFELNGNRETHPHKNDAYSILQTASSRVHIGWIDSRSLEKMVNGFGRYLEREVGSL